MSLATALLVTNVGGVAAQSPPGAALCAGCHAPVSVGSSVPTIAGHAADDIVTAMTEYRAGTRPGTIMGRIAKGFSADETRAIAVWLSRQVP